MTSVRRRSTSGFLRHGDRVQVDDEIGCGRPAIRPIDEPHPARYPDAGVGGRLHAGEYDAGFRLMVKQPVMRKFFAATVAALTAAVGGGCSGAPGSGEKRPPGAAVVVVSGGDAVSRSPRAIRPAPPGLAAGNTDTAIREYLLGKDTPFTPHRR